MLIISIIKFKVVFFKYLLSGQINQRIIFLPIMLYHILLCHFYDKVDYGKVSSWTQIHFEFTGKKNK